MGDLVIRVLDIDASRKGARFVRFCDAFNISLLVFEQERVDRLAGSLYQDKTLVVPLPGIAFSSNMLGTMLFGGVHRGFTPPSSGALKILNFGEGLEDSDVDSPLGSSQCTLSMQKLLEKMLFCNC